MRKVIAGVFVTLDGVMQAPGGPEEDPTGGFAHGGWVFDYWDESLGERMDALFEAPFDLLLGRRTYDIFAAYWPYMEDDPIGERFNAVTKFVATSSAEPLAWQNSVALRGDVPAEVADLKGQDGPNLLIQGSSVLIQSLLADGLIDEFRLLTFPLVLGTGKRLFGDGTIPAALTLADSRTSTTGVIMSRYVPEGPVHTGSFAQQAPSEAELARREKMRRGEW
jgi:dihydrofolate reductase